jgi:hypothetical protein
MLYKRRYSRPKRSRKNLNCGGKKAQLATFIISSSISLGAVSDNSSLRSFKKLKFQVYGMMTQRRRSTN